MKQSAANTSLRVSLSIVVAALSCGLQACNNASGNSNDSNNTASGSPSASRTSLVNTAPAVPPPPAEPAKPDPALAAEGKKVFFSAGCNACHGGTGGGGMCPPLINSTWVYGHDDDALRALITEGSAGMAARGKTRVGVEKVVGQMPPFGPVLKEGDVDKLLAFIHSIYKGG